MISGPRDKLFDFSPERFAILKKVMGGKDPEGVSMGFAAEKCGVTIGAIKRWRSRAEKADERDDPIIHELAEFFANMRELQAASYEDKLHQRAMTGSRERKKVVNSKGETTLSMTLKDDGASLMALLRKRDKGYLATPQTETMKELTPEQRAEMFQRLVAAKRLAEADALAVEDERGSREAELVDLEVGDDGVFD